MIDKLVGWLCIWIFFGWLIYVFFGHSVTKLDKDSKQFNIIFMYWIATLPITLLIKAYDSIFDDD